MLSLRTLLSEKPGKSPLKNQTCPSCWKSDSHPSIVTFSPSGLRPAQHELCQAPFATPTRMNLIHVPKKITFMAWDIHPLHRHGTGELPRCLRLVGGDVLAMLDFWLPSLLRAQPVQAGRIPASHHLSPSLQAGLLSAREMGT